MMPLPRVSALVFFFSLTHFMHFPSVLRNQTLTAEEKEKARKGSVIERDLFHG
jgi:hypothetical protein